MADSGSSSSAGHPAAPSTPASAVPRRAPAAAQAPPPGRQRRPGRARQLLGRGVPGGMARVLVYFLGINAIVLSVDALMAYALGPPPGQAFEGFADVHSVIPGQTMLPRAVMAFLWAVELDGFGVAGLLGIRRDPGDWRAWIMAAVAFSASFAFQVLHAPPLWGRGVAPVAWAGAALVLEVPRRARKGKTRGAPEGTPEGRHVGVAALGGGPQGALGGGGQGDASGHRRPVPPPTTAQAKVARELWAKGMSMRQVREGMKAAGVPIGDDKLRAFLATLPPPPEPATVASNGGGVRPFDQEGPA